MDYHLAAAVGRGAERPGNGYVLASGFRVDVEVVQHRRAVDGDVKDAIPRPANIGLHEVERHRLHTSRLEAGNRVGTLVVTLALQDRLRRYITSYL